MARHEECGDGALMETRVGARGYANRLAGYCGLRVRQIVLMMLFFQSHIADLQLFPPIYKRFLQDWYHQAEIHGDSRVCDLV